MAAPPDANSAPAKQEPLLTQLKGFPGIFWIANWMEVVERFSYYGLRTVLPVYMVLAYEEGGPQFSHVQKGIIYFWWAIVQSFLPVLSGGFADRFGYKLNISIATTLKIAGYVVMGYAIEIGAMFTGMSMDEVGGEAGGSYTYPLFFFGALLLAAGTAIFKPGLQGIIATTMPAKRASVGWGVFYQMVNIGGFVGPFIAAYLRLLDWKFVFLICAAAIALNYITLMCFREPERKEGSGFGDAGFFQILAQSVLGLLQPRLFCFTLIFAGFWLMFYQLFDILPNFIDDWVDSRPAAEFTQSVSGGGMPVLPNGNLPQEIMINLNALLISIFAFVVGYITGRIRALPSMVIGIGISVVSIYMLGMSMNGWWTLFAIGVFSFGEMAASPKKMEYLSSIAPPGKKGLYMGYVNATVGIGWAIGSLVAGNIYENEGDKVNLALDRLTKDRDAAQIVELLSEQELIEGYGRELGLSHLQTMELLFAPERLEVDPNAETLRTHFREKVVEDDQKQDLEALAGSEWDALVAGIAEFSGVRAEHVALIPATLKDEAGKPVIDKARAILSAYDPVKDVLSKLKDKAVTRRLMSEMGVSSYATHRVLYMPEVVDEIQLAALSELSGKLLATHPSASRYADLEINERMDSLFEEVGDNGVPEALGLIEMKAVADSEIDFVQFRSQVMGATQPISPQALALKSFFIQLASQEETPEKGKELLKGLFQRSRVMEVLVADLDLGEEGLDEAKFVATQTLWREYEPFRMWTIFALIGLGSMFGLLIFDIVTKRIDASRSMAQGERTD